MTKQSNLPFDPPLVRRGLSVVPPNGGYGSQVSQSGVVISTLREPVSAPYQHHSATSKAAAKAIEPRVGTDLATVLEMLRLAGPSGMTDEEMQAGMNASTQRPRRIELVRAGLACDSGLTRKTRSGREAVVWMAV